MRPCAVSDKRSVLTAPCDGPAQAFKRVALIARGHYARMVREAIGPR